MLSLVTLTSDAMHKVSTFLGAFTKLQKATLSFVMSVHPSVHVEQLDSHLTDFDEI
jgi:hypothetical protein